jgi:hypothetical protein
MPVKDSHTRIKPFALASSHGRYITVTPERTLVSVGEWPLHIAVINLYPFHFGNGFVTAVSLLKPPPGSRSGLKYPLKLLESSIVYAISTIVFQGGDDGCGYRNMYKILRGSNSNEGD